MDLFEKLEESRAEIDIGPSSERTQFARYIKQQAEEAWGLGHTGGEFHREGQQAGANALALHAISIEVDGYNIAEALTLRSDIDAFRKVAEGILEKA